MRQMASFPDMAITDALTDYLEGCHAEGFSEQTIGLYRNVLRLFVRFASEHGCTTVGDITLHLAVGWQQYLRVARPKRAGKARRMQGGRLAPHTVNLYSRVLRAFTSKLTDLEYLEENPLRRLKPGRLPIKQVQPLSEEDQRRILQGVDPASRLGKRDQAVAAVLLDTGMRASELCNLRVKDVDLVTGEVRISSGKGGKDRTVALGRSSRLLLRNYISAARPVSAEGLDDVEWLFLTRDARRMKCSTLRRIVRRLGEAVGVAELFPHRIRHTFGVSYLKAGGDVLTLQRILGHTTLHMVNHYMHLTTSDVVERHRACSPVDNLPGVRAATGFGRRHHQRKVARLIRTAEGKLIVILPLGQVIDVEP